LRASASPLPVPAALLGLAEDPQAAIATAQLTATSVIETLRWKLSGALRVLAPCIRGTPPGCSAAQLYGMTDNKDVTALCRCYCIAESGILGYQPPLGSLAQVLSTVRPPAEVRRAPLAAGDRFPNRTQAALRSSRLAPPLSLHR
jgi:hypothetical protein